MTSPRVLLAAILLTAVALRLPGAFWGLASQERLQVDETQHVGIALNVINRVDAATVPDDLVTSQWNARALGVQIALVGYPLLRLLPLDLYYLYPIGRGLVLAYAVGLVLVVYRFTMGLARRPAAALLAAALLAVFDLEATYGHMAVPVVPHSFWAYLTLLLLAEALGVDLRARAATRRLALVGVGLGIGIALRFEIVVPILAVVSVVVGSRQRRVGPAVLGRLLVVMGVSAAAAFYLATGGSYGLDDARRNLHGLMTGNQNVIAVDAHWLWNPVLYVAAIVAGTSLPACALFIAGVRVTFRDVRRSPHALLLFAFVLGTFLVLYAGDATFVRRAEVFLPFVAIVGGWGGLRALDRCSGPWAKVTAGVVVVYTLGVTIVSQRQFVADTRHAAADFLAADFVHAPIGYSEYARLATMPAGVLITERADDPSTLPPVLVLHEARYGRYGKYFTTPFRQPRCCDEVYHCAYGECVFVQRLFAGRTAYRLVRRFAAPEFFPERVLFKRFFGTYETMLGDVLIYADPARVRVPAPLDAG